MAALAALWLAGTLAVPMLRESSPSIAYWLSAAYAPACHQNAERCLTLAGLPLATCARCVGLYAGGLLGLIVAAVAFVGRRTWPRPAWFYAAVAPTLVDALLPWIGLPQLSNLPRFALALPAGLIAGLFLGCAVYDLFLGSSEGRAAGDRRPAASSIVEGFDG